MSEQRDVDDARIDRGTTSNSASWRRLRVLILYGGDEATVPRQELLAWLRGPSMRVDARTVAEASPHSEGAVDDRVDEGMKWANRAIAIVTADPRGTHGAPNIIDEIGRWRNSKGKRTLCIVRKEGVPVYSNHNGIVYVQFKDRISERNEEIRRFLGLTSRPIGTALLVIGGAALVVAAVLITLALTKRSNTQVVVDAQLAVDEATIDGPDEQRQPEGPTTETTADAGPASSTRRREASPPQEPTATPQTSSSLSDGQRFLLLKRLKSQKGASVRLVRIGTRPDAKILFEQLDGLFEEAGWNVVDRATIGMSIVVGKNSPEESYLTATDISARVVKGIFNAFAEAGVRLPLVPDADQGPGPTKADAILVVR